MADNSERDFDGSVRLHQESYGDGPLLVLGHGFGGSARNFRPQARLFQKTHRVRLFDARGHARSDAPDAPAAYRLSCFMADLESIAKDRVGERFIVGGLSMGAAVALHYALRYPERVSALIIASYTAGPDTRDWSLRFAEALEQHGLERAGAEFAW